MHDNLSLRVGGGVGSAEFDDLKSGDETIYSLNGGVEYKFDQLPVSLFGSYTYTDIGVIDANVILVGARFNLGGKTLRERNRTGADLDPFDAPF